jgi:multicomponent Na+:H+ antiporter subunit F
LTSIALVLLAIGAVCFLYRLLRGPSLPDRSVGLDGLLSVLVIGIIVFAARRQNGITVETVLVAALVAFVGTVAIARFIEYRGDS